MTIQESIGNIKAQILLKKTSGESPWDINPVALKAVEATVSDVQNYPMIAVKCLNCGLILSSLLVEKCCPNCGCLDLEEEN